MEACFLRRRILAALATSTLLSCGGETTSSSSSAASSSGGSSGSSGATASSTSSGSSGTSGATSSSTSGAPAAKCDDRQRQKRTCFAPDKVITKNSGYGGVARPADAAPLPPPTREANGCVVVAETMSSCCNPAISGPVLENGQCCYEFCEGACCGRPLVVDGTERLAPLALRSDWSIVQPPGSAPTFASTRPSSSADSDSDSDSPTLDAFTRAALRDDWARDALMEHASIASFAVFTLELLALGAPPDLVRDAQAAASDEVEHARLTFAIANRYSDSPVGPGPLDATGIKPSSDLAAIAAACVRDGCINETIASSVAMAQASNVSDSEMRTSLERIANDEARHAELAWRFVQWALQTGGEDVRNAVMAAFDTDPSAHFTSRALPDHIDTSLWRSHGRLLPTEHDAIVRSIHDNVIAPCLAALLGASPMTPRAPDTYALS